jgi:hypothetical protein
MSYSGLGQTLMQVPSAPPPPPNPNAPTLRRDAPECAPWTLPYNAPGAARTAPPVTCYACPPGQKTYRPYGTGTPSCVEDTVAGDLSRSARDSAARGALAYFQFVGRLPGVQQIVGDDYLGIKTGAIAIAAPLAVAGGAYYLYRRNRRGKTT